MALNKNLSRYFNQLENQYNLPNGTLASVASIESNFNPNAKAKGSTASGMFQFTKATASDYNLTNPFDPYASAQAAAKYISNNAKRYGGDIQKAVLAFHSGPGEVDKHGTDTSQMSKYVNRGYLKEFNNRFKKFGDGSLSVPDTEDNSQPQMQTASNNTPIDMAVEPNDIMNEFGVGQMPSINVEQTIENPNKTQIAGMSQSYDNGIVSPDNAGNDIPQNQDPNIVSPDNPAQNLAVPQQAQQARVPQQQTQGQVDPATDVNSIMQEFGVSNQEMPQQQAPQAVNQQQMPNTMAMGQQQPQAQSGASYDDKDKAIFDKFVNTRDPLGYYQSLSQGQQNVLDNSLRSYLQAHPEEASKIADNHSKFQNFAVGAATSLNTGLQTGKQLLGKLFGNQDWVNEANTNMKAFDTYNHIQDVINPDNAGGYTTAGKIGGEVLGTVLLPQAKVAQLGRYGNMALNGGIGAGLFTGATSEGSDYWKDKAIQSGIGAVAGPLVAKGVEKVANPIANFVGRTFSKTPAATQAEIDNAAQQGYKYFAGDLANTSDPKGLNYLARTNPEINATIRDNAEQAGNNIEAFRQKIGSGAVDSDNYVNKYANVLAKANDGTDPYYQQLANEAISKVRNADQTNPNELLKSMANLQWLDRRLTNTSNYNAVDSIAPTGATSNATSYSNYLSGLRNEVNGGAFPDAEADQVLNYLSKGKFDTSNMSITDYNSAIKQLGNKYRTAKSQGNATEAYQYNQAQKALQADKDAHLASITGDKDYAKAYGTAQGYYKNNIAPVNNDSRLANTFNAVDKNGNAIPPDNLIEGWIKKGDTANIKKLYNQLDPESQTVFKNATLNKLYNESLDKNSELSLDKFKSAYNSYASKTSNGRSINTLDTVFSGAEKQNFNNLIKGLQSFRSYAASKADPQTGVKMYDTFKKYFPVLSTAVGVGASASTGVGMVPIVLGAGAGGASYLFRQAYIKAAQDPKMAKYFVKLSKVSPGTEEFIDAMDNIIRRGAPAVTADMAVGNPADPQNNGIINTYLGASGQNPQNQIPLTNDNVDYFSRDMTNKPQQQNQGRDYFSEALTSQGR